MMPPASVTVVVVGDGAVGKTTLRIRLMSDVFESTVPVSIGAHVHDDAIFIEGVSVPMQLWDTTAQEFLRGTKNFADIDAVMVVYDLTCRQTFQHALFWLHELMPKLSPLAAVSLVATKLDRQEDREVLREEALLHACELGLGFAETSAFDGTAVRAAFQTLVATALRRRRE